MNFSLKKAREVGDKIGVDWGDIDVKQFRKGLLVELEHGTKYGQVTNVTKDDPLMTGRIALAHLLEFPDYYTRLEKMEKTAEQFWRGGNT